ncbi:MAG: hypothetical protein ABW360_02760 [Phenylobacterium sp.]
MALTRRARQPVVELVDTSPRPRATDLPALVASALEIPIGEGFQSKPISVQAWQQEAWRLLDIIGEFRFLANRQAGALSRCRIYVAELDEYGKPGKECEEVDVQALSESVFGGHTGKAEAIRLIGLQLYIAGESYVVAEDRRSEDKDVWYTLNANQITPEGNSYEVKRPQSVGGGKRRLTKGKDLLMRIWTPHPSNSDLADGPARSVLPVMREIERLSMLTMSQIDSRLISAGLMLLPAGIDFPHAEDTPGGIVGLMEMILEAAKAQLQGAGTAAGLVPILAEIPVGSGSDVQHLTFSTPVQGEIKDKLDHAIRRLALGLDAAPEELLGQGDSNHWSAWAVDETSIKLFISPILARICDALTIGYLKPALEAMGKPQDADGAQQYVFWYDTAPLAARPDQREDAFKLYEKGLISSKALLDACNFTEDDAPDEEERVKWMLWELAKLNPALATDPAFQKIFGLPPIKAQGDVPGDGTSQPAIAGEPGPGKPAVAAKDQKAIPAEPKAGKADADKTKADKAAKPEKGEEKRFAALLPVADLLVTFALDKAGGRIVGANRSMRGRHGDLAKFDLHTVQPPGSYDEAEQLLAGGFDMLERVPLPEGVSRAQFKSLLEGYTRELLVRGYPHQPKLLSDVLERWNGGA